MEEDQDASEFQTFTGVPAGAAKAAGLIVKEDVWEVERTVRIDGKETTTTQTERIPVRPFIVPPETVGASYGITVNLGNFNSAKSSVWRTRPCYSAEVEECWKFISGWLGEKIGEEQEALKKLRDRMREEAGGGGGKRQ